MPSICKVCGKKFAGGAVPYAHKIKCENEMLRKKLEIKEAGEEPVNLSEGIDEFVEPNYKKKPALDKEAVESFKRSMIRIVSKFFDYQSMSGNERAMVNRMIDELKSEDGKLMGSIRNLLFKHGIDAYYGTNTSPSSDEEGEQE